MANKFSERATTRKTAEGRKAISKRMLEVDPAIIITADYLANQYGEGLLGVDAMADILKVKERSVIQYISEHKVPFKVTKIGGKWVTLPYYVAEYLVQNAEDRSEFYQAS